MGLVVMLYQIEGEGEIEHGHEGHSKHRIPGSTPLAVNIVVDEIQVDDDYYDRHARGEQFQQSGGKLD